MPFLWGLYTGEEYHEFSGNDCTLKFIEFLEDKEAIVYAHNGGKFDWHYITEYIPDFEPLTIINGRLAKFNIGMCEFRDSYNIIPAPLAAYKKTEITYDIFEKGERDKPKNKRIISEYLKDDCVFLYEMVTEFVNDYGMNLTLAGASMKVWSKLTGIKKPESSEFYYNDMKKFYYGGRTECFKTGIINHPFTVKDINSAYPYGMTFKHPWGTISNLYDNLPDFSDEELGRCFITLKARSMGAFPYRAENGLFFPNDNIIREFNITGWEYNAAKRTGTLKDEEIISVIEFLDNIEFNDYVNHFYAMKNMAKENNDNAKYLFAKIFLNALYGKFASNPENYQEFMTLPANMIEGSIEDGWNYCALLSDDTAIVNKQLQSEKRRYYDVAVSASITGFVRAYLWESICKCDTPLYCDTDSIAAFNTDDIELGTKLGQWENEGEFISAAIAGKKLYAFERKPKTFNIKKDGPYKTASKGVRLKPAEIITIAKGGQVTYEPEAPTYSLKRGNVFTPRTLKLLEENFTLKD